MSKDIIIMNFSEESKSYQAFSEIKKLVADNQVPGEQMAILDHQPNHQLVPKEYIDFTGRNNNVKGSLIGMLVGILAGPLGMLLGWFTGGLIGSSKDNKELEQTLTIFEETIQTIPEGSTGVILIADEKVTGPIDDLVKNKLGGEVVRIDQKTVETELDEASKTEKELAVHAQKYWKDNHKS